MGLICWAWFGASLPAQVQTFNSGSTGADGALEYTTPGTYYFDPTKFNPPLNPAGNNIFNFTTITIAKDAIVRLSSKFLTGPIIWLATGDVEIWGQIDLSGEDGARTFSALQSSFRVPAAAGAGGYAGGLGGMSGGSPAQAGHGPGGGPAATSTTVRGGDATVTGNQFLSPLFGGSGGGGGLATSGNFGAGGGGGGGALLIASSTKISFGYSERYPNINADGGNRGGDCTGGTCGGAGAGGAVRIIAPTINSTACCSYSYIVARGARGNASGANGKIRLEAFTFSGNYWQQTSPPIAAAAPGALFLPTQPPSSIKVTSINGVPINANPFTFPDTTINTSSPVVINIEAHYIPVGTVPKITIFSEVGNDQTVNASALSGTLAISTSTVNITFPSGGSRGYVKATW